MYNENVNTRQSRINKQIAKAVKMDQRRDSHISRVYVQANAERDRMVQKIVNLVNTKNEAQIARLPAPWREKFNSFSHDKIDLLYMDERLVITQSMR